MTGQAPGAVRTQVAVLLTARKWVYLAVDHAEDEEPTDLTPTEQNRARELWAVGERPELEIERVEVEP